MMGRSTPESSDDGFAMGFLSRGEVDAGNGAIVKAALPRIADALQTADPDDVSDRIVILTVFDRRPDQLEGVSGVIADLYAEFASADRVPFSVNFWSAVEADLRMRSKQMPWAGGTPPPPGELWIFITLDSDPARRFHWLAYEMPT